MLHHKSGLHRGPKGSGFSWEGQSYKQWRVSNVQDQKPNLPFSEKTANKG